jgi:hypothetical protein
LKYDDGTSDCVYWPAYAFVWAAFSSNKLNVQVPDPPQQVFAAVNMFDATADLVTTNLVITVRTTDVDGVALTDAEFGQTPQIGVELAGIALVDPPKAVKAGPITMYNMAMVKVSGLLMAAQDSVIAYLKDIEGTTVASEWVTANEAGFFEAYVDGSTLLDGRLWYTAVAMKNGYASEPYTPCADGCDVWPEVMKDTAPLDGPDNLTVVDWKGPNQAGDNGGVVMGVWDPSEDHVDQYHVFRQMFVEEGSVLLGEVTFETIPLPFDSIFFRR